MDRHGYAHCTPRHADPAVTGVPFADLTSGYIVRAMDEFPRQGSKDPWRRQQNYLRNRLSMRRAPIADAALEFARAAPTAAATTQTAA
jgi:monooxygenase